MKIQLISTKIIYFAALALFSTTLTAYEKRSKHDLKFENEFRFFMEGALHKGSDNTENIPLYARNGDFFYSGAEVAVVGNYSGTQQEIAYRDKIEAGGYFRGSFGAEFPVAENLAFSTSIGFLYDEITGDLTDGSGGNGYASFRTTVIDFLGFYNLGRHRFGLGGTFHYNPKFDYKEVGNGFQMHAVYRFSNALGASIQYDYLVSKNTSMGVRYTDVSYDFENVSIGDRVGSTADVFVTECIATCEDFIDASSFSGHITYRF
ncbi:MAG: hypothetical protein KUG78_16635 [Kangiellaceae bacterium]|nr:hypothetical protein [Kangiellaceae bacterium]